MTLVLDHLQTANIRVTSDPVSPSIHYLSLIIES